MIFRLYGRLIFVRRMLLRTGHYESSFIYSFATIYLDDLDFYFPFLTFIEDTLWKKAVGVTGETSKEGFRHSVKRSHVSLHLLEHCKLFH